MERAQAKILGNCWVTIAEIAARLGINVARPWCNHLYATLQLNRALSMSLFDLELQYNQAPAVLPIIQQKYLNIAHTFLISLVHFLISLVHFFFILFYGNVTYAVSLSLVV
jgi:hypothetical protein